VVVPSWLTVWVRLTLLVRKVLLPLYVALIVALPVASLAVLYDAVPPESVTVPSVVEPFMNVTEPVGIPLLGAPALTVAVKVTDCL
jgi:hypothetical protein